MINHICAQLDDGVDTLLRVVGVLRRKNFDIQDVRWTDSRHLEIAIEAKVGCGAKEAKQQMEKLVGLRSVVVREEKGRVR